MPVQCRQTGCSDVAGHFTVEGPVRLLYHDTLGDVAKVEFLNRLSEILEVPPGSLTGDEKLEDLEDWTSMAMVSFIAFAHEHFGKTLSPRLFGTCDTVNDLGKLVGIAD